MLKFATKKAVKTGCISVGPLFCISVGNYIKEIKKRFNPVYTQTRSVFKN